jgi:2-polyprenyl-6-methoxyphenol hydroxylase-like FAD-dependent oxidoreductase
MSTSRQFRVIIVGAGVAGLTLANALEQAEIDYVLLERRGSVDPQYGASLGMCGNGSRVLDQLGVQDELEKVMEPMKYFNDRWADGSRIQPRYDLPEHLNKRYLLTC